MIEIAPVTRGGQGGQFTTQSFINGQFLIMSNNTTIEPVLLQTNVFYIDNKNLGRWAFMNTNFVPSVGQNGTNYIPAAVYWTNNQAYSQTNALIGGWTTNAQTINPPAIVDVTGWVDAYGSPAQSVLSFTTYGIGSRAQNVAGAPTNTITVTMIKSSDGTNYSSGGQTVNYDYMTFAFSASAGTNFTYQTNVPTTFMQGARSIRLGMTSSNVASGTNVVFSNISLNGWVP